MNFSDFKKLLGADPWNRDPDTLRARRAAPEFQQAAEEAEAFERKLQDALEVPVDSGLADDLVNMIDSAPARIHPHRWMALAATIVLIAGAASIYWLQIRQPQDVHVYVAQHLSHDGASLLAKATGQADPNDIRMMLARFEVTMQPSLAERIRMVKYCPTPDGKGVHMVLATDQGPAHLIFMPQTPVVDGEEFRVDGLLAHLLDLELGSAAIVGTDQQLEGLDQLVRSSLQPVQTRT